VRDDGGELCISCSKFAGNWQLLGRLIVECICRAGFVLFLTKRSLESSLYLAKLDAVLLRIFVQFMTINHALNTIDLSTLRSYNWHHIRLSEEQNVLPLFQFPPWYHKWARIVFSFTGTIPSIVSTHETIQCIVYRLSYKNPATSYMSPRNLKAIVPLVFWFLYPLIVCVWVIVLAIIIVKVWWPLV